MDGNCTCGNQVCQCKQYAPIDPLSAVGYFQVLKDYQDTTGKTTYFWVNCTCGGVACRGHARPDPRFTNTQASVYTYPTTLGLGGQMGWICPKCNIGNAPFVQLCLKCNDLFPDSSTLEQLPKKHEDPSVKFPVGEPTFAYCVVRKELSGGALLAHVFHAGREALGPNASEDERVCILQATKVEMEELIQLLKTDNIPFKACIETDGPLAGSTPSIGFSLLIANKENYKKYVGKLKVWRLN